MSSNETSFPRRVDRRDAIKWMLTAAASSTLLHGTSRAATAGDAKAAGKAVGYGTDPDVIKTYKAGELWPLTFAPAQRATAGALCDVIIPEDAQGPAASKVGVPDFIDEWISAPYAGHDLDRTTIVEGLQWLEAESQKRFKSEFANLLARQKNAICDDICSLAAAKSEFRKAGQFFARFRDLTAGGYYTTPEGMKDIGYTGNTPIEKFAGPPPEVLKKLGLV